jgi:hypothetical protein
MPALRDAQWANLAPLIEAVFWTVRVSVPMPRIDHGAIDGAAQRGYIAPARPA